MELKDDGKTIVVHVTEAAERNKANKAIVKAIAKFLNTTTANVTIIKGMTSSTKRIRVDGIDAAAFDAKVQSLPGTS